VGLACAGFLLASAAGLAGCGGTVPQPDLEPIFPPHPWRPLRVAIAPPHEPLDLGRLHAALADWSDRPSERRRLAACTWQEGLPTLASVAWPATELSAIVLGRWPLGPTDGWCEFSTAGTDTLTCRLTREQPLAYARQRGLSHLVVPRGLSYAPDAADQDSTLLLSCGLAVVDVVEGAVVWTGRVAARREDVKRFQDLDPDLTAFERATYAWLVELARTFARIETWPQPNAGLRAVALSCHERPRVFVPPEDAAEAASPALETAAPAADADAEPAEPTTAATSSTPSD
jgi:hypothetical protein